MDRGINQAPLRFALEATSDQARAGRFETPHGRVETPTFMPVGTHGAVKAMTPAQVRALVFAEAKKHGLPVLLVTHDPADAEAAGGRIVALE